MPQEFTASLKTSDRIPEIVLERFSTLFPWMYSKVFVLAVGT